MSIQTLDVINVRNIRNQTFFPSPSLNFIYGKNASGKSALIEAIYLLGRAKSFRSPSIRPVITFDQESLVITAKASQWNGQVVQLGIQLDGKEVEIRINQQSSHKRSDLAYSLPLQIIHPKSFELLDGGAQIRREFLDWGIFNHEKDFLSSWRKYKKAHLHRNALLKLKNVDQLHVWNREMVNYGKIVRDYRIEYIEKLKPIVTKTIDRFMLLPEIDIKSVSGWDESKQLEDILIEDLEKDIRYGYTHSGPHRGDFFLTIGNKPAKEVASRGQLKLLVICLKLAQVELVFQEKDAFGCVLFDDFAAELDIENRAKILNYLQELRCQVFITATERNEFGDLDCINDFKMFHVEQGNITCLDVPCGTS